MLSKIENFTEGTTEQGHHFGRDARPVGFSYAAGCKEVKLPPLLTHEAENDPISDKTESPRLPVIFTAARRGAAGLEVGAPFSPHQEIRVSGSSRYLEK